MKTTVFLLALFGFTLKPDRPSVTVAKIQGLDVYVYSTPDVKYETLDKGKVVLTLTGGCDQIVNQAVDKARKAGADAVLVDMQNAGALGTRWEAIKYKQ